MRSSLGISVTLHHADASEPPAVVLVYSNQHGELPAVLVDPVDRDGRIARGMWLSDSLGDRTDSTSYLKLGRPESR
jgi:hypothetical protein